MDRDVKLARVAALAAGLLGSTSCYGREFIHEWGKDAAPVLVLLNPMPADFGIGLRTGDERRKFLEMDVRADGKAQWRVWDLATERGFVRGVYQADAECVASIWRAVVDARFDKVDEGESAAEDSPGTERFVVRADGAERFVWRPSGAADLVGVRASLLATLPPEARRALGR